MANEREKAEAKKNVKGVVSTTFIITNCRCCSSVQIDGYISRPRSQGMSSSSALESLSNSEYFHTDLNGSLMSVDQKSSLFQSIVQNVRAAIWVFPFLVSDFIHSKATKTLEKY